MRFRPCIDLHKGRVKQIVGATLSDAGDDLLLTNYETTESAAGFAEMYRRDGLEGGHVVMLGPGNEDAAQAALRAYPGGLHIGGGVTAANAGVWLDRGAAKVIVTSYAFPGGRLDVDRLRQMVETIGREHLVLDLSCRLVEHNGHVVVADRWQTVTDVTLDEHCLAHLAGWCSEFLIHATDVEGRQQGVDRLLLEKLGRWSPITTTYAGGIGSIEDMLLIDKVGQGRLDATVGSALDIFGGTGIRYRDLVAFDHARRKASGQGTPDG